MPFYDYYCYECGKTLEIYQGIKDEKLSHCTYCGGRVDRLIGQARVMKDTKYRDVKGEIIHFPSDERPYFDKALNRTFHTKKEKWEYMKDNNLIMDGSSDKSNRHRAPEAGDTKYDSRKVK